MNQDTNIYHVSRFLFAQYDKAHNWSKCSHYESLLEEEKKTLLQYGGLGGGFAGENNTQIWMMEPGQRDSTWRGVSARLDQHSIPGY